MNLNLHTTNINQALAIELVNHGKRKTQREKRRNHRIELEIRVEETQFVESKILHKQTLLQPLKLSKLLWSSNVAANKP